MSSGLRDQPLRPTSQASQPDLQRRSLEWPVLPTAQQVDPSTNRFAQPQGRWAGGPPAGSRDRQAEGGQPPRHPCEEEDDGGFYQAPTVFAQNSSLKRPYSADVNQPQNSRQFANDGFRSEPPRPPPVSSQTAEPAAGTPGTPDYNALMQHLQYYQSQMNSAQWRGNN